MISRRRRSENNNPVTVLDVGGDSLTCIIGHFDSMRKKFRVFGGAERISHEIRNGEVLGISNLADDISDVVKDAQRIAGRKASSLILGIGGPQSTRRPCLPIRGANLRNIRKSVELAGFSVGRVSHRFIGLARMVVPAEGTIMLLDLPRERSSIGFFDKGKSMHYHQTNVGLDLINQRLVRRRVNLTTLFGLIEQHLEYLRRSHSFPGLPRPEKILVNSPSPLPDGWRRHAQKAFGAPAESAKASENLMAGVDAWLWKPYLPAIGLISL